MMTDNFELFWQNLVNGREALTDVKVYLYLLKRAIASREAFVSATKCTAIADEIGVHHSSVSRSLTKLSNQHLIARLPNGDVMFVQPLAKKNAQTTHKPEQLNLFARKGADGSPTSTRGVGDTHRDEWRKAVSPALGGKPLTSQKYLGKTVAELLAMRVVPETDN